MGRFTKKSITFKGKVGNIIAYTRSGDPEPILALKSLSNRKEMKRSPRYASARANIRDMTLAFRLSGTLRDTAVNEALYYLHQNLAGFIKKTALAEDRQNPRGMREMTNKGALTLRDFKANKRFPDGLLAMLEMLKVHAEEGIVNFQLPWLDFRGWSRRFDTYRVNITLKKVSRDGRKTNYCTEWESGMLDLRDKLPETLQTKCPEVYDDELLIYVLWFRTYKKGKQLNSHDWSTAIFGGLSVKSSPQELKDNQTMKDISFPFEEMGITRPKPKPKPMNNFGLGHYHLDPSDWADLV